MAKLRVSDHAMLRWLERTGALEVEQLRDLLSASLERASGAAAQLGVREYLILADDLLYVVRGSVLVTVIKDEKLHDHVRALDQGMHA